MTEKTLCIIKPDAVSQKQAEEICDRIRQQGLRITDSKKYYQMSQPEAERFYAEHRGKPFFEGLIETMTKGPCWLQVLEGEHAITRYRSIMGPTDPSKAEPGTLRADFGGKVLPRNAVHGSDSPESAQREIGFFFA